MMESVTQGDCIYVREMRGDHLCAVGSVRPRCGRGACWDGTGPQGSAGSESVCVVTAAWPCAGTLVYLKSLLIKLNRM